MILNSIVPMILQNQNRRKIRKYPLLDLLSANIELKLEVSGVFSQLKTHQ
jgi:hypothetical protein